MKYRHGQTPTQMLEQVLAWWDGMKDEERREIEKLACRGTAWKNWPRWEAIRNCVAQSRKGVKK